MATGSVRSASPSRAFAATVLKDGWKPRAYGSTPCARNLSSLARRSWRKSSDTTGKLYLQRELHLLRRGERVDVGATGAPVVAERLLDECVDVAVRVHRVVVEDRELLHARFLRQRQGLLERGVAEAGVRLVLLIAVLGVVDEQVRIAAPVGKVPERAVRAVGEQGDLVVRGEGEPRSALVDAVAERRDRVHQEVRRDPQPAH